MLHFNNFVTSFVLFLILHLKKSHWASNRILSPKRTLGNGYEGLYPSNQKPILNHLAFNSTSQSYPAFSQLFSVVWSKLSPCETQYYSKLKKTTMKYAKDNELEQKSWTTVNVNKNRIQWLANFKTQSNTENIKLVFYYFLYGVI